MQNRIDQETDRTVDLLCEHGVTRRVSDQALRRRLETFAKQIATAARSEFISSVRSAEDAAEAWGVSTRRAQAHIAAIHERHGVAARIGRAWLITDDEIERHRPGESGRPKKAS